MKQSAVDRAYSWLRQQILDGSIAGGTFVDEATVCEAAGVSRTPAREAFNRLEGERFITLVPRRGAQVRELNMSDLYDAFNARVMIESFAATELCSNDHPVPTAMAESAAIMDQLHDLNSRETQLQYLAADQAFHAALVHTLSNRAVTDFFDTLWRINQWGAINRAVWLRSESFVETNRHQHHRILDALARRDAEEATAALREHLRVPYSELAPPLPR